MLALDSPRWATLKASAGGTGALAARLLRDIRSGSLGEFVELYHQACHQLTVGEVAYAVVPHVVEIAGTLPMRERVWPLVIAGTVAACCAAFPSSTPPIPDDLQAAYAQAQHAALLLATDALRECVWRPGEATELLAVVSALHGRCDLALHLFLHGGSDSDLSCPECGEYIRWSEQDGGEPATASEGPRT
jgi:hypothetical protein